MQLSQQWWQILANHLWRTYFVLVDTGTQHDTPVNERKYAVCHNAYLNRSARDREIIRAYYTAKWGDSVYAVEDHSARTGIPTPVIYAVLASAKRAVVEELGLIEPERR